MKTRRLNLLGHCEHYDVRGGEYLCLKGVDIRAHVGGPDLGWCRRMPCINDSAMKTLKQHDVVPCALREFPTPEQVKVDRDESDRRIATMISGSCPDCGKELLKRENEHVVLMACPDGHVSMRGCKAIGDGE